MTTVAIRHPDCETKIANFEVDEKGALVTRKVNVFRYADDKFLGVFEVFQAEVGKYGPSQRLLLADRLRLIEETGERFIYTREVPPEPIKLPSLVIPEKRVVVSSGKVKAKQKPIPEVVYIHVDARPLEKWEEQSGHTNRRFPDTHDYVVFEKCGSTQPPILIARMPAYGNSCLAYAERIFRENGILPLEGQVPRLLRVANYYDFIRATSTWMRIYKGMFK